MSLGKGFLAVTYTTTGLDVLRRETKRRPVDRAQHRQRLARMPGRAHRFDIGLGVVEWTQ
jgi:hypothetical protein